jgi:DNA polymerase delta subunit 1
LCCSWVAQLAARDLCPVTDPSRLTPPLRVLSWDIECYSASGEFPDASKHGDAVINIGIHARTFFSDSPAPEVLSLCLGAATVNDEGCELVCLETEESLFLEFAKRLRASDADVVVGYNTTLFDWPYLTKRVEYLSKEGRLSDGQVSEIFSLSRLRQKSTPPENSTMSSSAYGDNPLHLPRMPGRFEVDLWFYLKRENSTDLPDLKLNTVSKHYLNSSKVDLPPHRIFSNFSDGSSDKLGEIATYCIQDTTLVLKLVETLCVVQSLLQMSAVAGVVPFDIAFRGQQVKVYTQLLRKARELNYVLEDVAGDDDDTPFKGAHVVAPKAGFYTSSVVTLDFASLYPSIMRTWNLSPDTLLRSIENEEELPTSAVAANTPHRFVAATVRRGLLPLILDELLAERKKIRVEMKKLSSSSLEHSLLNCRQLALKISANSCYGFTGCRRGTMTCIEVAESTTGIGRHIIERTAAALESGWPGAAVIYGDTDRGSS